MVIETEVVIGWFKLQLKMWLFDLNYNFECVWLIELSDNKLSDNKLPDNNLTSELVENRSFLNQSQPRKLYFIWLQKLKILHFKDLPQELFEAYLFDCVEAHEIIKRSAFLANEYTKDHIFVLRRNIRSIFPLITPSDQHDSFFNKLHVLRVKSRYI